MVNYVTPEIYVMVRRNHELIQNIIEFVQLLICVILIFYFCIITPKSSKYKYQEKIGKFLFFVGLIMLFLMYFFN